MTSSSLYSHTITVFFIMKYQSIVSTMSTALEHGISSLVRSEAVGECLVVVGHENNDRFVRVFSIDEAMDDSINDLFFY